MSEQSFTIDVGHLSQDAREAAADRLRAQDAVYKVRLNDDETTDEALQVVETRHTLVVLTTLAEQDVRAIIG